MKKWLLVFLLLNMVIVCKSQKTIIFNSKEIDFFNKELMYQNKLIELNFKELKRFYSSYISECYLPYDVSIDYLKVSETPYEISESDSILSFIHEKILVVILARICEIDLGVRNKKFKKDLIVYQSKLNEVSLKNKLLNELKEKVIRAITIVLENCDKPFSVKPELENIYQWVYDNCVKVNQFPYFFKK